MSCKIIVTLLLISNLSIGQSKTYQISNESFSRTFEFSKGQWLSTHYLLTGDTLNFLNNKSREFALSIDDQELTGRSKWNLMSVTEQNYDNNGKGFCVTLAQDAERRKVILKIHYVTYMNMPMVRKWIEVKNVSNKAIKLEKLNTEDLHVLLGNTQTVIHHNYARMKHLGRYVGDWTTL